MSPLGKLELVRFGDCSGELVYGTETQVLLVLILMLIINVRAYNRWVCNTLTRQIFHCLNGFSGLKRLLNES